MDERDLHYLKKETKLNGRYIITSVLGEGGFGITYYGVDDLFGNEVAIKEFFPQGIVTRNNEYTDNVTVTYAKQDEAFLAGKKRFIGEARVMAKFNGDQGIVNVTDFFEANNTAYIVMEYLDGITLKEYLKGNRQIPVDELMGLLAPLLESLDDVHQSGLIHRDISPDNIMVLKDGSVKLMDFGAARDYTEFGEKSLSIVLKPGYAPAEQYQSRGVQGPWTDIYALSATIYKCITGITPEESMQRVIEDSLEKPSKYCKDIPKGMENAIMKGMAALQKNRYQNLKEFCEALYSDFEDAGEEKKKPVSKSDGTLKSVNEEKEKAKSGQNALGTGMEKLQNLTKKQKMIAGAAVILVVLLIFAGTSLSGGKKQNSSTSNLPTEREMVSDVVKNSQWEGTILNLSIIDDDINRQYEVYTADCEIESKRQGGSGTTSKAKITYKLQDDEWVFVKCEKQN